MGSNSNESNITITILVKLSLNGDPNKYLAIFGAHIIFSRLYSLCYVWSDYRGIKT